MTATGRPHGLMTLGTLPVAAALVVGINGLYVLLVAFGNITDPGTNFAFVQHVLSMDTTNFGQPAGTGLDPDVMWRAVTGKRTHLVAYIALIVWEVATAFVLLCAFALWIRERGGNFRTARATSTIGLCMLILLFMGGFITVGGEWFQMWKSVTWNGVDPAFRNSMLALAGLILIHMPSESGSDRTAARRALNPDPHAVTARLSRPSASPPSSSGRMLFASRGSRRRPGHPLRGRSRWAAW